MLVDKENILICLLADSQAGKTELMVWAEKTFRPDLYIVRSTTTRRMREEEIPSQFRKLYRCLSLNAFLNEVYSGELLEFDVYAGCFYGTHRLFLDRILNTSHGIITVTEKAIPAFRAAGYKIVVIKIVPINQRSRDSHHSADTVKYTKTVEPDYVLFNDFSPGGLIRTREAFAAILRPLVTR